ncbi:MAG: DUF63 family protein [Thermoplasmatota archaeon]
MMHRRTIIIAAAGIAAGVAAGFILAPELVYDQFIWKYFVGPVVADAVGEPVSHHGVEAAAGYTLLSELVYGLLLLVAFYGMYRVFQRLDIKVDARFIAGATPFIILGATLRTLEDSGLFERPLTYLFISPVIYIQIGVYVALGLLVALLAGRTSRQRGRQIFAASLAVLVAGYAVLHLLLGDWCIETVSPLLMAGFALLAYALYEVLPHHETSGLFSLGIFFLLPSLYLIGIWVLGNHWRSYEAVNLAIVPLVVVLASGITGLVYVASRWLDWQPGVGVVNLSMLFGHMVDGWVSYLAVVDPLGMGISYGEKHPLPLYLMENAGGIGYPLAKLGIILAIIYGLDVYLRDELTDRPMLTGLIKFFVLILGLSPGLRDLLRIVMGI